MGLGLAAFTCALSLSLQDPSNPPDGTFGWLPPPVRDVVVADAVVHQDTEGGCAQQLQVLEGAPGGGFVAAWRDLRDGLMGIYVARLDAELKPLEPERPMYAPHTARRLDPSAFVYPDGGGAIAWTSAHGGGSAPWLRAFGPDAAWQSPIEFLVVNPAQTPPEDRPKGLDRRKPVVFPIDAEHMGLVWVWQDRVQYTLRNKRADPLTEVLDIGKDAVDANLAAAAAPDGTLLVAWHTKNGARAVRGAKEGGRWQTIDLGQGMVRSVRAAPGGGWALLVQDNDSVLLRVCDERGRVQHTAPLARGTALQLVRVQDMWCALVDAQLPQRAPVERGPSERGPGRGRTGERQGILTPAAPPQYALYFVAQSGELLGEPYAPLPATAVQASAAQLASNGTRLMFGWTDLRAGQADIYARLIEVTPERACTARVEQRLNTDQASSDQLHPMVGSNGQTAWIAWGDRRAGAGAIYVRRAETSGLTGAEVRIGAGLPGAADRPQAVVQPDGGACITWRQIHNRRQAIYAQIVQPDGTLKGAPAKVVELGEGDTLSPPSAVLLRAGARGSKPSGYAIAWTQAPKGGAWVRRLDLDGAPQSVVSRISEANDEVQDPAITQLRDGRVVIAWTLHSGKEAERGWSLRARFLGPTLERQGAEFGFEASRRGNDWDPSLTPHPAGGFLMAWCSGHPAELLRDVCVQGFDAQGKPLGPQLTPCYRGNEQDFPEVITLADGSFAVAWEDDLSGLDQTLVRRIEPSALHMFGTTSTRLLNELDTLFVGDRVAPRIAPLGEGLIAVFGDRRRSLGLDVRAKILGKDFDQP